MATIIDKQNIKNKLKLYKKNLDIDLNCPNGDYIFNKKIMYIFEDNDLNIFNLYNIYSAIGEYKIITEPAQISNQELVDKFNTIKLFIHEKQQLANLVGKKLLIIIGEAHNCQKSILFELMLVTYLKAQGMNSLLVEFNDKEVVDIESGNFIGFKTPADFFAKDVLDFKLTAIDPLKEIFYLEDNPSKNSKKLRDDAINKAISENSQQNQICLIGANHFKHIINSPIIEDKFVIAAIDVGTDITKNPQEILNILTKEEISIRIAIQQMPESLTIDLSSSLESFSLGQIYEIYENNIDLLLTGDSKIPSNKIYRSDFVEDTSICEGFDTKENIIKALGMFAHNDVHHHDL
jgi:hypothetical protein